MKKIWIISACAVIVILASCSKVRRNPGRAYMPDMAYSRAYETYSSTEKLKEKYPTINYNSMPVAGTIARGDMLQIYPYHNDSLGYVQSASVKNPFSIDSIDAKEAERLYLVNCGICHGPKLDGNGPLWKDGNGPYPAAPKNFMGDDMKKMADGTYFHSITYGKGQMGSYASQLNTMQRWMVIAYIRSKQGSATAGVTPATADTATKTTPKQP
ncbi:MAG TPA: c-type cytochrome [Chitinophagaceae bacterium]|jgi:mono/diheme cytochrome c family protein|nr:c-type cytochrome [Chitinophagaceae bacterium]